MQAELIYGKSYIRSTYRRSPTPTPLVNGRRPYVKKDDGEQKRSDLHEYKVWLSDNKRNLPRIILSILFTIVATCQVSELDFASMLLSFDVQVAEETIRYLGYPTGINVLVDEPHSMRDTLPGVTVCDKNRCVEKL